MAWERIKKLSLFCLMALPVMMTWAMAGFARPYWGAGLCVLCCALAFGLSFLPGRIGKQKDAPQAAPAAPVYRGKYAESDGERFTRPEPQKDRRFPLRAAVGLLAALGVFALTACLPLGDGSLPGWAFKLSLGLLAAIALFLALREAAMPQSPLSGTVGVLTGLVIYLIAGLVAHFCEWGHLSRLLALWGGVFLVVAGLTLNEESLKSGIVTGKAPRAIARRNRVMVVAFGALTLIVVSFEQIWAQLKAWAMAAVRGIFWLLGKLGSLFAGDGQTQTEPLSGGGEQLMLGAGGEPSAFARFMEKVALVLACAVAAVLLFFLMRKIVRLLRLLVRRISEYLGRFKEGLSEEYVDERESLVDLDDARAALNQGLEKLRRRFQREKPWREMDEREKVRKVVRGMYQRAAGKVDHLQSLTIQQAAPLIKTGRVDEKELTELYDRARYAPDPPEAGQAERLRKEAQN